jgi:hypothetical protein
MTGNSKRKISCIVLTLVFLILLSPLCLANPAEPPTIIIVVPNAPSDLEITLNTHREEIRGLTDKKFMETQFKFHVLNYREGSDYSINLILNDNVEEIEIGKTADRYLNIYYLDYKTKTLEKDTTGQRVWIYTGVRILLTLLLEALVFLFFGFKKKKSWILFIIINLLTQGILNIWLNTVTTTNGYLIFALIGAEIFVFAAEIAGFLLLVKEHKKLKTFIYVIFANFISLILGGYLITLMPM